MVAAIAAPDGNALNAVLASPDELCPTAVSVVLAVELAIELDDTADDVVVVVEVLLLFPSTISRMLGQSGAVSTWP